MTTDPYNLAPKDRPLLAPDECRYLDACTLGAREQGLDPVYRHLKNRGLPVVIEQTGGFCMVAGVYSRARDLRVWITEDEDYAYGERRTQGPPRYLVVVYEDADEWSGDEGTVLAERATLENVPALVAAALDYPHAVDTFGHVDREQSAVSVELEACEPEGLPAELAQHHVRGEQVHDGGRFGWPEWRYTGTVSRLLDFLDCQYEDGSGEPWGPRLAEIVRV